MPEPEAPAPAPGSLESVREALEAEKTQLKARISVAKNEGKQDSEIQPLYERYMALRQWLANPEGPPPVEGAPSQAAPAGAAAGAPASTAGARKISGLRPAAVSRLVPDTALVPTLEQLQVEKDKAKDQVKAATTMGREPEYIQPIYERYQALKALIENYSQDGARDYALKYMVRRRGSIAPHDHVVDPHNEPQLHPTGLHESFSQDLPGAVHDEADDEAGGGEADKADDDGDAAGPSIQVTAGDEDSTSAAQAGGTDGASASASANAGPGLVAGASGTATSAADASAAVPTPPAPDTAKPATGQVLVAAEARTVMAPALQSTAVGQTFEQMMGRADDTPTAGVPVKTTFVDKSGVVLGVVVDISATGGGFEVSDGDSDSDSDGTGAVLKSMVIDVMDGKKFKKRLCELHKTALVLRKGTEPSSAVLKTIALKGSYVRFKSSALENEFTLLSGPNLAESTDMQVEDRDARREITTAILRQIFDFQVKMSKELQFAAPPAGYTGRVVMMGWVQVYTEQLASKSWAWVWKVLVLSDYCFALYDVLPKSAEDIDVCLDRPRPVLGMLCSRITDSDLIKKLNRRFVFQLDSGYGQSYLCATAQSGEIDRWCAVLNNSQRAALTNPALPAHSFSGSIDGAPAVFRLERQGDAKLMQWQFSLQRQDANAAAPSLMPIARIREYRQRLLLGGGKGADALILDLGGDSKIVFAIEFAGRIFNLLHSIIMTLVALRNAKAAAAAAPAGAAATGAAAAPAPGAAAAPAAAAPGAAAATVGAPAGALL